MPSLNETLKKGPSILFIKIKGTECLHKSCLNNTNFTNVGTYRYVYIYVNAFVEIYSFIHMLYRLKKTRKFTLLALNRFRFDQRFIVE